MIIGTMLVSIVFVAGINLWYDPYHVFHVVDRTPTLTANERFNKLEHLYKHPDRYNAFFVGSSRMGVYDPDWMKDLRPGKRYYNLSVFSGDSLDVLDMLKALKKRHVLMDEVLLGIDIFPFIDKQRSRDVSMRHHPDVLHESRFKYLLRYLFTISPTHIKQVVEEEGNRKFTYDFTNKGKWYAAQYERLIKDDPKKYQLIKFPEKEIQSKHLQFVDARFEELKALRDWLATNNIELIAFLHPVSNYQLRYADSESIAEFSKRIAKIIPDVDDLMTERSMTRDISLFYDPEHYRPVVASRIVRRLYLGEKLTL